MRYDLKKEYIIIRILIYNSNIFTIYCFQKAVIELLYFFRCDLISFEFWFMEQINLLNF